MRSLLALVLLSLIGCATDDQLGSSSQSIVVDNRLSGNRLAGNRLAGNRLAGNRLAGNRLAGNRLELNSSGQDLVDTADGRDVLTYIISCALPEGTTIVATDSAGNQYEFFGEIGLAPQWLHHALDRRGRGWVSACLFSRVNAHDVAVAVSLRGPSHALVTTPDEVANWTVQEGAFYGQYFLPVDQPIAWFACRGRDIALAHAAERDCAEPDPANPGLTLCGFNFAGDCGDYTPPPNPTACRRFSPQGYYTDCAEQSIFAAHGHAGGDDDDFDGDDDGEHDLHGGHPSIHRQVITTFVHG